MRLFSEKGSSWEVTAFFLVLAREVRVSPRSGTESRGGVNKEIFDRHKNKRTYKKNMFLCSFV